MALSYKTPFIDPAINPADLNKQEIALNIYIYLAGGDHNKYLKPLQRHRILWPMDSST